MSRYVCIHGHFYQPPRENAWSGKVEAQPSAAPYHDWNQRVTAECYRPNTAARRLDADGRVAATEATYPWISFNFGPTLLAWLERHDPEVYAAVLAADRASRGHFGGHGSALAQAYHHTILPLDASRDAATQIEWGVRDFQARFGRDPEGIWLPEAAVSLAVLGAVAAAGIRFTVLAPGQARHGADGRRACRVVLPGGREVAVFFYNGDVAHQVAFGGLLRDGPALAAALAGSLDPGDARPQLAHIATDGETYGHHHRFGEMALLAAIDRLRRDPAVRLTNYGEFLALHPPEMEVEIAECSSWSCSHGVERWRSDCGCNSGGHPEWRQAWRGPLRQSLEWLRDRIAPEFERVAGRLLPQPWAARDAYVEVVIGRTAASAFLERFARVESASDTIRALECMELQHNLLRMFTSCGWFFDEISGIETVQILQYAARALQLAERACGLDLRPEFLDRLAAASGNLPEMPDGRAVFIALVQRTELAAAEQA